MSDQKIKLSAILIQILASLGISVSLALTGLILTWPSCTVENFTSNNTVLSSPMSTIEISLLGSLTTAGALVGTLFCGYALRKFGRRYSAILFDVPVVITWTVIYLTSSVPLVLIAIAIGGLGCGGYAVSLVYISEVSQESVRGVCASFTVTLYFVGVLLLYVLGGFLSYYQVILVCLLLSIIHIVILALLKESPVFLIQNGMEKKAAKSIAFYRQIDTNCAEVKDEIIKIKLQLNQGPEQILNEDNDVERRLLSDQPKEIMLETQSEWKLLLKSESAMRALAACLIAMITSMMTGNIVIQVYADPLFRETAPSMDSSKCAIYLGIDLILASAASGTLVDHLGRKSLFTASGAATGLCALLLGSQLILHWAPHWFTAFLIYVYACVYSLGLGVVPFVLSSEVFLPEVRGLCNSIVLGSMWLSCFVSLFIFNPLVEAIGLGPVFCGFSIPCFLGALYSQLCLPETKGLTADAVQFLFMRKKDWRSHPNIVNN